MTPRQRHDRRVAHCMQLVRRKLTIRAMHHVRTRWLNAGGYWTDSLRAGIREAIVAYLATSDAERIVLYHAMQETDPARCNKHTLARAFCRAMYGIGPLLGVLAMGRGLDHLAAVHGDDDCRIKLLRVNGK